jgi:hypothetical protein
MMWSFQRDVAGPTRCTLQRKSHLCIHFLGIAASVNFHIHVSVSDFFPKDRSTYFLQQNRQIDRGNTSIVHRYMTVGIWNEAALFHYWEYIN